MYKNRFKESSGRANHMQVFGSEETKTCDYQLFKHDLERQNIIGQNKGWQR
jgi:hypothetical protein